MQELLVESGYVDRRKKLRFGGTIPPWLRNISDHGINREICHEKYSYD